MTRQAKEQFEIIKRGTVEIVPESDLLDKLARAIRDRKPLKIKLGLDPTAPDIHLGSAVVLRKMRKFQDMGHEVHIIIGDFTAGIGDPTGKSVTRPQLSREEIDKNAKTYYQQFFKILDPDKTVIHFNSEWLGSLSFTDAIRVMSHVTMARLLERDDFQKRLSENRPIAAHEITYPICQAYDSVVLEADVEVGGTEQKFNILMGRTLQGAYEKEQQVGLFMPILTGLDGVNKMSKSLGNYVGITESPSEMFGKLMSISDEQMQEYFELCTDVDMEEVKGLLAGIAAGSVHPMDVKKRLAREIIAIYHSKEEALAAQQEFERVFSQKDVPQDMPSFEIAPDKLEDGKCSLMTIVQESGLVGTNSEIRRLISSGAISLDGAKYTDFKEMIAVSDGMVIKAGKRKFAKLVMK
ncbi:MAG: tyrosine--tRNA ligase [Abditibacteriota bacterium]|nr:tyrosine--tRNA ligase [Abditibacteriota bacterium]